MKQIAKYPFIQLDEGEYSLPIKTFQNLGLHVQIKHKVYDDFTILAMIRQNLGISILYQNALSDYDDLCLIPIQENLFRHVGIAYNNYDTLFPKITAAKLWRHDSLVSRLSRKGLA